MACRVCGSVEYQSESHSPEVTNVCHTCGSEWTDWYDAAGHLIMQTVTKNTRTLGVTHLIDPTSSGRVVPPGEKHTMAPGGIAHASENASS